jgi:uncharacterized membrane protein YdjX (TVP38/TMEM64 family)
MSAPPESSARRSGPAWLKIAAFVLLIAGVSAVWRYTPLAEYVTAERVSGWSEALAELRWAPLLVIFIYTPAAFVLFPRPLITLAAVIAFGPWLGFSYAMSGILLAGVISYYVGRALPRAKVRQIAGQKLHEMSEVLRKRGLISVLAVRVVPLAPFVVINIVAGAVRIKLWHFVVGTALGLLPGTLTTTVFGGELQAALEDPSKINYWLVGGVVLVFVLLTLFMRRWFAKQHRGALQH